MQDGGSCQAEVTPENLAIRWSSGLNAGVCCYFSSIQAGA
jgi:hypothetical protein